MRSIEVDLSEWDSDELIEELDSRGTLPSHVKGGKAHAEAIFMELQAGKTKLALEYFADILGRVA